MRAGICGGILVSLSHSTRSSKLGSLCMHLLPGLAAVFGAFIACLLAEAALHSTAPLL